MLIYGNLLQSGFGNSEADSISCPKNEVSYLQSNEKDWLIVSVLTKLTNSQSRNRFIFINMLAISCSIYK